MTSQQPVEFEEFYPPLGRWFEVRAYPSAGALAVYFHDSTDSVLARQALGLAKDELELRVSERTAELRAVAGELEAFSSSVAHDLRAPLASISGFSQVLAEREGQMLSENVAEPIWAK